MFGVNEILVVIYCSICVTITCCTILYERQEGVNKLKLKAKIKAQSFDKYNAKSIRMIEIIKLGECLQTTLLEKSRNEISFWVTSAAKREIVI